MYRSFDCVNDNDEDNDMTPEEFKAAVQKISFQNGSGLITVDEMKDEILTLSWRFAGLI